MDVRDVETWFFVVLVLTATVIFVKGLKRRKQIQKWHERPRRPDLSELEDVQRREYRRPL